jgi:hypothetical protein
VIKVLKHLLLGPIQESAHVVADEILRFGCTSSSASEHTAFVAHLRRWMVESNHAGRKLTVEVLE